ncbi:MAG: hypothetical protein ACRENP_01740 [Longimicrobiales bacterium]
MRRRLLLLLVLTLTLSLPACMLFRKRTTVRSQEPVTLQVVNNNWNDIVVYALIDGTRTRLGDVGASRTTMLKLPTTLITASGMLQLILDPLGSRSTFRTGQIMVNGGQRVRLLIENELRLTSWTVQ